MAWKSSFWQNYRTTFSPTVPPSAAGLSHVVADVEAPGGEKWEHLKSGGKQWQANPKNLPRMQRTRAIPVAYNPSGRTMALGLTQPLTEMSTRRISWGVNVAGA